MSFLSQFFSNIGSMLLGLFRAPRNMRMSLPGVVAVIVGLLLVLCVILIMFVSWETEQSYLTQWWKRVPVALGAIIVIMVLAYYGVKIWMQESASAFADIDRDWKAGLKELAEKGISPLETPLFLILGGQGSRHSNAIMSASRVELSMEAVPKGAASLHWYANHDGIYVILSDIGCLSRLATTAARLKEEYEAKQSKGDLNPEAAAPIAQPREPDIRSTAMPDQLYLQQSVTRLPTQSPFAQSAGADIRGTMMPSSGPVGVNSIIAPATVQQQQAAPRPTATLDRAEFDVYTQRLEHLCRLVRQTRGALCPINGAILLLPYELLVATPAEAVELRRAAGSDSAVAVRTLQVRFPLTTLVVDMEQEKGFIELVDRVGREKAKSQRFGKGLDLWAKQTKTHVDAATTHACNLFESWTYHLFREKGALAKSGGGNRLLYSLLCKVRYYMFGRLKDVLTEVYAENPEAPPQTELPVFSGCYFGATSEATNGQAFVKDVFVRLTKQQEDLEWTAKGLHEDRLFKRIGYFCAVASFGLFGFACVLFYNAFSK
jgi:hypothetical protein